MKTHLEDDWGDLESSYFIDLEISLKWYIDNCLISGKYLQEEYDKLKEAIRDKYLIYNLCTHHRFTVRYQLTGDKIKEEINCLFDRETDLRRLDDIVVGKIVKYKGLYLKIIEVYEILDKKYGRFMAETLSVDELIKIRKGGY